MIMSKEDEYQQSYAIFTSSDFGIFSVRVWSKDNAILGVADDYDTLYFIKFNGEVVAEITKRHLKISSSIIGLFSNNDSDMHESYLRIMKQFSQSHSLFALCQPPFTKLPPIIPKVIVLQCYKYCVCGIRIVIASVKVAVL
ncbi:hypothetical protein RYX36_031378 [Vicia faba]